MPSGLLVQPIAALIIRINSSGDQLVQLTLGYAEHKIVKAEFIDSEGFLSEETLPTSA